MVSRSDIKTTAVKKVSLNKEKTGGTAKTSFPISQSEVSADPLNTCVLDWRMRFKGLRFSCLGTAMRLLQSVRRPAVSFEKSFYCTLPLLGLQP